MALHQHKVVGDIGYDNCHYWPHYSFRPSLIDVAAILTVGNYDTPNQFFEMDYAHKWMHLGFLSGFYNQITNRHIGRLTSERNDKTQPNAYELNDESQFVAAPKELDKRDIDRNVVVVSTPLKKRYFSTIPFDDGFGAQFQRFIWTCIYAEEYEESQFVYRSPKQIAHNYNDDPQFITKLEELMNMKSNYLNYNDAINSDSTIEILTPDFYDIFNYVDKHIDTCMKSKSMERIKEHYWRNKDRTSERLRLYRIPSPSASDTTTTKYTHHLSVHIRRPNCDDTRPNGGEEYTNEYYIRSLLNIRETYLNRDSKNRIQYHIYSQGTEDKFADLCKHAIIGDDIMMHLNDTNEDTFIGMTLADILVTSASSYSYTAAFLCDGDIYYTEFWHKPCSWWNKLEKLAN
jgi:hypothetical protein